MKKFFWISALALFVIACSNSAENKTAEAKPADAAPATAPAADDSKGVGKFTKVDVGATLDVAMADAGNKIYDLKCSSCHKLTDERLVGPGWKDVTTRRKPEWIMNFVTNVDEMLNKDAAAQAQLEICLVRMPNQNLTDEDARNILEYMRKNDGVK